MTIPSRGRCNNFGNCTKADTREDINITDPYNALCPECGLPLVPYQKKRSKYLPIFLGTSAILAVGWGVLYFFQEQDKIIVDPPLKICSPLLMEGKKSLYQRILTKPKAYKTLEPGQGAEIMITPFSRYYVYERRGIGDQEWLNIGSSINCQKEGWMKAADTIPWKQQLSLTLTNPALKNRGKAYFFKTKDAAEKNLVAGTVSDIIAAEPEQYVDWQKTFYLLPILNFERRNNQTLLQVAGAGFHSINESKPANKNEDLAIVFVVDTTVSMKPYINKVKETVQSVYDRFHQSPYQDHVKFGFLGFRSNITAKPELAKLEYVTRMFISPNIDEEESNFVKIVSEQVREANISSLKFDEDSYAGVLAAINQIDWEQFLGRNIILVTDAGAIEPKETLRDGLQISAVGDFTGEMIKNVAKSKGINLYALHLKTHAGKEDHKKAEWQYRNLTKNDITDDALYYSHLAETPGKINGSPKTSDDGSDYFGDTLTCIVQRISATMLALLQNDQIKDQRLNSEYCPKTPLEDANPDFSKQKDKLREDQLLLGNALRLKYLGATENANIPDVVEAWISGKTVEANVLLSRNELSNLAEKIKSIVESDAESKSGDGSQAQLFFRSLKKKASILLNDPKRLSDDDAALGELFNLEELEDLPYTSRIMQITEAEWEGFNLNEREDILRDLRAQLAFYKEREATPSDWKKLADELGAEEVTLVPVTLLP